MLQIKNTLGGGKPEGLYVWKKNEIGSEPKEINESVSTLPFSFTQGSAVIYNGEIHILGSNVRADRTKHYKWNGTSWTEVSTLPYSFYGGAAVVFDNEIHILGGNNNTTSHYKWNGSSWISVSTLPYNFIYGSAVVLNGEIHILGSTYSSSTYTSHYKWDGTSWTEVSTLPYYFNKSSAVVFNGQIHILGSGYDSIYYKYHYKFDGTSWTSVSTLPYSFYEGSVVIYNNEIHILGSYEPSANTNHYKYDGTSWTSVGTLPYELYYGSAVVFNNAIHTLGSGYNSNYYKYHYLVYGYVPVYTFLDYIVSDKENAYPDGGEKDGYWYERVSSAKIASGSIAPSSSPTNLVIEHGLGKTPKQFYLLLNEADFTSYRVVVSAYKNNIGHRVSYASPNGGIYNAYAESSEEFPETIFDETNITVPTCYSSANKNSTSYQLRYYGVYKWFAIAE